MAHDSRNILKQRRATVRMNSLIEVFSGASGACGWDMPAWQTLGAVRYIVTPDDPPEGAALARWNIVDKSAPVAVTSGTTLEQNQYMPVGGTLATPGNTARLVMQPDGNRVLYRNSDGLVLWASDTDRSGAVRAYMQYDGNLVLQRADNFVVRATGTDGRPGATFKATANGVYIDAYGMNIGSGHIRSVACSRGHFRARGGGPTLLLRALRPRCLRQRGRRRAIRVRPYQRDQR
jgi:hypothetical protein